VVETEFVVIARLIRPQGRRGEILADILTDFPEKFSERRQVWVSGTNQPRRELELESCWMHKGRVVLKFAGIGSISEAETLAGMLVEIPRSQRIPLELGSFYVSDLVGSELFDLSSGRVAVGVVEDVEQGLASAPLLIVRKADRQFEIPFAAEYVVRFDAAQRVLEMKLPPGLLEINVPLSPEEKLEQRSKSSPQRTRRAQRKFQ
jgi:16S rRNA processing protein RimM